MRKLFTTLLLGLLCTFAYAQKQMPSVGLAPSTSSASNASHADEVRLSAQTLLGTNYLSETIAGSENTKNKQEDESFSTFTNAQKKITQAHLNNTSLRDRAHPNFGEVYEGTQPDAVELLEKRTETQREFINPDGSFTYQGISNGGIYKRDGFWVTPNYNLQKKGNQWEATQQANPAYLLQDGSTEYFYGKQKVSFNNNEAV